MECSEDGRCTRRVRATRRWVCGGALNKGVDFLVLDPSGTGMLVLCAGGAVGPGWWFSFLGDQRSGSAFCMLLSTTLNHF